MQLIRTAAPQSEPLSAAEARARLNISTSVTDPVVTSWITAARQKIEGDYGLSMIDQTWSLLLDHFPYSFNQNQLQEWPKWTSHWIWGDNQTPFSPRPPKTDIDIPMQPLTSSAIQSVKYLDADSIEQTMPASDYRLVLGALNSRLMLVDGKMWPMTALVNAAVNISFKAGYANAAAVPEIMKSAICLHIGYLRSLMGRDLFLSADKVPGVREIAFTVGGGAQTATEGAIASLLQEFRRPMS